ATDKQGERRLVLLDLLHERRDRGAHDRGEARLLGNVERGRGALIEAVLDQPENSLRAREVLTGDAQPILALEHQKIGVGDAHYRPERNPPAVEAACERQITGGANLRARLAPETELIAGVERRREQRSLDRRGSPRRRRAGGERR